MNEDLLEIAQRLTERGCLLSTAESCTGGLIGHLLTNVPGSSKWYMGGAVTYSNALKHGILGVRRDTLDRFGAVSSEVAEQMAIGARQAFDTDYAISVTGVAGPDGGTPEKPIGLTYIGVAAAERVVVRRFDWGGSRVANKQSSADAAIALLRELLQEEGKELGKEGVAEKSTVEASFNLDGTIRPRAFLWKGRTMQVTDWGRTWKRDGVRYFLIMTLDNRVWELRFEEGTLNWTVQPKSEARYVA